MRFWRKQTQKQIEALIKAVGLRSIGCSYGTDYYSRTKIDYLGDRIQSLEAGMRDLQMKVDYPTKKSTLDYIKWLNLQLSKPSLINNTYCKDRLEMLLQHAKQHDWLDQCEK